MFIARGGASCRAATSAVRVVEADLQVRLTLVQALPKVRLYVDGAGTLVAPRADMPDQVIARVDLPGATNADVSLQVHQTRLLITAGPEGAAQLLKHLEGDGHVVYRRDRGTGGFFRSMLLPQGVRVDDIKATMKEGVLLVTAPATDAEEAHA